MSTDPHLPRKIRHRVDQFINSEGERDMTKFHERQETAAPAAANAAATTFSQRAGLDPNPAQLLQGDVIHDPAPSSASKYEKLDKRAEIGKAHANRDNYIPLSTRQNQKIGERHELFQPR